VVCTKFECRRETDVKFSSKEKCRKKRAPVQHKWDVVAQNQSGGLAFIINANLMQKINSCLGQNETENIIYKKLEYIYLRRCLYSRRFVRGHVSDGAGGLVLDLQTLGLQRREVNGGVFLADGHVVRNAPPRNHVRLDQTLLQQIAARLGAVQSAKHFAVVRLPPKTLN